MFPPNSELPLATVERDLSLNRRGPGRRRYVLPNFPRNRTWSGHRANKPAPLSREVVLERIQRNIDRLNARRMQAALIILKMVFELGNERDVKYLEQINDVREKITCGSVGLAHLRGELIRQHLLPTTVADFRRLVDQVTAEFASFFGDNHNLREDQRWFIQETRGQDLKPEAMNGIFARWNNAF